MFNICVCDDEKVFLNEILKKIKCMAEKNNISINLYQYPSGNAMLFDIENNNKYIDICFMDVLMDGLNGIETASSLRRLGLNAQIIFLTCSKEHVFEALDVMPLHYLIKQDVDDCAIERILLKAVDLAERNKKQKFIYKVGHTIKHIDIFDIMYFEIVNRIVKIHYIDGQITEFYYTINKLEKEVNSKLFVRTHRSFLVNLSQIDTLKGKQIVCKNQEIIPIGEKYMKNVREEYSKFMLDQIGMLG